MTYAEATRAALRAELSEIEAEISRLCLNRERASYRLEQALRERDRLACHLRSSTREEASS